MPTISQYALGILLLAHGYVHVWYVVASRGSDDEADWRGWNGRSWLLSGRVSERVVLDLTSVGFVAVAIGFAAGGVGYVLGTGWWWSLLVGSAALSTLLYVVLWDGEFTELSEKGLLGVLLDLGVLGWLVLLG